MRSGSVTTPGHTTYRTAARALKPWLRLTERHGSLIRVLTGDGPIATQVHYPDGDLIDPPSGTQCYYHCHRGDAEHGHLHLFRRPCAEEPLSHLIAISLDQRGLPVALFTVNRWVCADQWLPASVTPRLLRGVSLHRSECDRDLSLWLIHFLRFYRLLIQDLLRQRDQCLQKAGGSLDQRLEDRSLEILSFSEIDWMADLIAIETQQISFAQPEIRT